MDLPSGVDDLLSGFGERVRPVADVVALYVGGSLATGDYHDGVSDIDLVAVIERRLTSEQRRLVRAVHRELLGRHPAAAKLHCVYVPFATLPDVRARHVTWTGRIFLRRRFTVIARAEFGRHGHALFGVAPQTVIPSVTDAELCVAVRRELTGYWTSALQRHWIWLRDFDIDLGLLTLPRAEAAMADGRLITKAEALTQLDRFAVPPDLVAEIGSRRDGRRPAVPMTARLRRAMRVHRIVSDGINALLSAEQCP